MFWVWLIVIQLFIFTALILFLRILWTKNVSSATAHLHELNSDYNEKIETANKKKAEVDSYYNEMLLKAKADAEKQKVQILREAQATQDMVVKDARRQGEDIIGQASKAQEMAMAEIEETIEARGRLRAGELMMEVLSKQMSEHLHQLWVNEVMETGFENVEKLHTPDDVKEIKIQTAFALTAAQKSILEKKILAILDKKLPVTEEIVPDLVAGVAISLGSLAIDGSLRFKIREAAKHVKSI